MAVDDLVSTLEHELELTGLAPHTRYYYTVGTIKRPVLGKGGTLYLDTPPIAGSRTPVRFVVLGDTGGYWVSGPAVRDALTSHVSASGVDLLALLGDNAYYTGTDTEYQAAIFDMYGDLLKTTPLWSTRGNHDELHSGQNNDYYDVFTFPTAGESGGHPSGTEAYYSFDYANVHFVCLDSQGSNRSPSGPMVTWLTEDLAEATQDWTVAFFHHPTYSKGTHDSDDPVDSGGRMRDMREFVLPVLEAGGVDLVLMGHSHAYERSMLIAGHYSYSYNFKSSMIVHEGNGREGGDGPYRKPAPEHGPRRGTVYVVIGSSSWLQDRGTRDHPAMPYSELALGFLSITVDGIRLDCSFIDDALVVRDQFTIIKDGSVAAKPRTWGRTKRSFQ